MTGTLPDSTGAARRPQESEPRDASAGGGPEGIARLRPRQGNPVTGKQASLDDLVGRPHDGSERRAAETTRDEVGLGFAVGLELRVVSFDTNAAGR